jgi:hypothetical protein
MQITKQSHRATTQGYCNHCGITDAATRKQLFDFADGIFDLGLWNNFVCWPLRSTQNRGTGTTVFSLGGLGTFNGTMVNGPSWTTDGIRFIAASAQYVTCGGLQQAFNVDDTYFAVGKLISTGTQLFVRLFGAYGLPQTVLSLPLNATGSSMSLRHQAWTGAYSIDNGASPFTNLDITTGFSMFGISKVLPNTANFLQNTETRTSTVSHTSTASTALHIAAGQSNDMSWNGDISIGIRITAGLSTSQMSQMYSLYKSTLGQGLGLP